MPVIHRIAASTLLAASLLWGADLDESRSEMRAPIERYTADRNGLLRTYTVDRSPARRERMTKFYREWLDELPKLKLDSMSQDGRVDYLLFRNHLQHELRQLDLEAKIEGASAALTPFAQTIVSLEESRRRMEPIAAAKAAATLDALAKDVEKSHKSLESSLRPGSVKKTVGADAAAAVSGLRATLKRWFDF